MNMFINGLKFILFSANTNKNVNKYTNAKIQNIFSLTIQGVLGLSKWLFCGHFLIPDSLMPPVLHDFPQYDLLVKSRSMNIVVLQEISRKAL